MNEKTFNEETFRLVYIRLSFTQAKDVYYSTIFEIFVLKNYENKEIFLGSFINQFQVLVENDWQIRNIRHIKH